MKSKQHRLKAVIESDTDSAINEDLNNEYEKKEKFSKTFEKLPVYLKKEIEPKTLKKNSKDFNNGISTVLDNESLKKLEVVSKINIEDETSKNLNEVKLKSILIKKIEKEITQEETEVGDSQQEVLKIEKVFLDKTSSTKHIIENKDVESIKNLQESKKISQIDSTSNLKNGNVHKKISGNSKGSLKCGATKFLIPVKTRENRLNSLDLPIIPMKNRTKLIDAINVQKKNNQKLLDIPIINPQVKFLK